MKTLNEIIDSLAKRKKNLLKKYPIKSLAIFGSYSRNEQNEKSDLDILVEFDNKIGMGFIDLADELENSLHLKVDLVSKKGIKERYFQAIKSDLIYV
jgi:predicted nucleotidyltransferase